MRLQLPLLTLTLFLAMAANGALADETAASPPDTSTQPSNIEDWDEDVDEHNDWTFFGMGYESRQAASGTASASGGASGAVSSIKKGGSKRGK